MISPYGFRDSSYSREIYYERNIHVYLKYPVNGIPILISVAKTHFYLGSDVIMIIDYRRFTNNPMGNP